MKPLLLQLHFWEGGNEKRRCLNWPGQGPASTAPALKVSSPLCGASEGNSAQAGHRMPTALWARESDFQEPKASSAVCPAVHVSWSAPQMSPSHRALMDTWSRPSTSAHQHVGSSRWASSVPQSAQSKGEIPERLQQREAETGGIPFPQYTRDDALMNSQT